MLFRYALYSNHGEPSSVKTTKRGSRAIDISVRIIVVMIGFLSRYTGSLAIPDLPRVLLFVGQALRRLIVLARGRSYFFYFDFRFDGGATVAGGVDVLDHFVGFIARVNVKALKVFLDLEGKIAVDVFDHFFANISSRTFS